MKSCLLKECLLTLCESLKKKKTRGGKKLNINYLTWKKESKWKGKVLPFPKEFVTFETKLPCKTRSWFSLRGLMCWQCYNNTTEQQSYEKVGTDKEIMTLSQLFKTTKRVNLKTVTMEPRSNSWSQLLGATLFLNNSKLVLSLSSHFSDHKTYRHKKFSIYANIHPVFKFP